MDKRKEKTKKEYPAGHSVDTEWYLLDKDGHIAVFDSGESGWFPAEYDTTTNWNGIIEEALLLNSELISPGLRKLVVSQETQREIKKILNDNKPFSFPEYCGIGIEKSHLLKGEAYLNEELIELRKGTSITDLHTWQEQLDKDTTLIYQLSKDATLYYVKSIKFNLDAIKKDLWEGRLVSIAYSDDSLFNYYFSPKENYQMEAIMEKDSILEVIPTPIAYKLPENFHNLMRINASLSNITEINLDDYMGMYNLDLEYRPEDSESFCWPYYYGPSDEVLNEELFKAIVKLHSRTVWCILNRYKVSPNVFLKKAGKTAIALAEEQYEKYIEEKRIGYYLYSSYRILKMLQLKMKEVKK